MRSRICALLFFAAFLFSADRATAQLAAVKIGHNAFTDEAVFYLGRDVGIFKKHGIHLEMIYIPGGSLSVQALIGNSLDMLLAGGTPLVYAVLKGADLKYIAGLNNRMPYVLVAREGINSPEQLRGKKIGISRFGSNTDFVVKLAAMQMGLNPKRDIQIIQVGGQDARGLRSKPAPSMPRCLPRSWRSRAVSSAFTRFTIWSKKASSICRSALRRGRIT
jgi:ABC-type nitrate/sulfonate/bicarbonate transport system substrate-binding protein